MSHNRLIKFEISGYNFSLLTKLDLSFNYLDRLSESIFKGLRSLKFLYLNSNSILVLEDNFLRNLNSLEDLYLNNNRMGVKISIDKHMSELDDILEMSPHYLNKVTFESKISPEIT